MGRTEKSELIKSHETEGKKNQVILTMDELVMKCIL